MEYDHVESSEKINIEALESIYGDLYTIEDTFALLSLPDVSVVMTHELYSDRLRERIIVTPKDSSVATMYEDLHSRGVSLLDKVKIDDNIVFLVPKNTRTVESVAVLVDDAYQEQNDIAHYMPIFRLLGRELSLLHSVGLGSPAFSSLQQFAFYPDRDSDFGARVVFLPPFSLSDTHSSGEMQLESLHRYLLSDRSPVSTAPVIHAILKEIRYGWQER